MKRCKLLLALALLLLLTAALPVTAAAVDTDEVLNAQSEALDISGLEDAVPESAEDALDGLTVLDALRLDDVIKRLLEHISGSVMGAVRASVKSVVTITAAAVLCAVVSAVFPNAENTAAVACVLAIAAVAVGDSASLSALGGRVLEELNTFSKMLLPTLAAASAASGAVTSAAAKYAAAALFMDIFISAGKNLVLPLIYAYIAASVAAAAFGGDGLTGAASLIKWAAVTMLTSIVLAFTAYLSLTGVISGTTDAVAVKTAKMTISALLPVVGGMVADAADTVLAGASLLKGAAGVFGLIVVAAVIALPVLRLGSNFVLYKAAGGLAGAAAEPRIGKLISSLSTAFGLMLGLVGTSAIMLFISVISVIKAAT